MRKLILPSLIGAALLLAWSLPLTAGPKGKPMVIELKNFQLKAKEGVSALNVLNEDEPKLCFYTNGWAETTLKIPADGDYEITVKASCDPAMDERAKFKVTIDGKLVGKETLLTDDGPKDYVLKDNIKAGERKLTVEFTNDAYKEGEYDRNLYVHGVTLTPAKGK